MDSPRPRPPHSETPGESAWLSAARELARNPDSPQALKLMSAVNSALAPAQKAAQQVVDALELQVDVRSPSQAQSAAVSAAIAYWEKVCGTPMNNSLLDDFRTEARQQAERKKNRPPQMSTILAPPPTRLDVGYGLGIHLEGIEGTWHRLWALLSLTFQWGDTPEGNTACESLREQFEQLLGRQLQPREWDALVDHARAHAAARRSPPGEGA